MNSQRIVTFFAKSPRYTSVKTRLGRSIGFERASALYEAFLADLIARFMDGDTKLNSDIRWVYVSEHNDFPALVAKYAPAPCAAISVTFASYGTLGLARQQTEQLRWSCGQRYGQVVHLLTDVPHIPVAYVRRAFELLNDHDLVVGPSCDGGYYLFGTRAYLPLFEGLELSTSHVLEDMRRAAGRLGLKIGTLPTMFDIDNEQDLTALIDLIRHSSASICPATWRTLRSLRLV